MASSGSRRLTQSCRALTLRKREFHGDRGSNILLALNGKRTGVLTNERLNKSQPKSSTFAGQCWFIGSLLEGISNVGQNVRRDSTPVVLNGNANLSIANTGMDLYISTIGRIFDRVRQQINQYLLA